MDEEGLQPEATNEQYNFSASGLAAGAGASAAGADSTMPKFSF